MLLWCVRSSWGCAGSDCAEMGPRARYQNITAADVQCLSWLHGWLRMVLLCNPELSEQLHVYRLWLSLGSIYFCRYDFIYCCGLLDENDGENGDGEETRE